MTTKEPIDAMVIRHLRGTPAREAQSNRTAPIRVVCAWCRAVLVDVPGDTSHGICESCAATEAARR